MRPFSFRVKLKMRIARDLKIHSCLKCNKPLDDADFTQIGVQLGSRYKIFFDYICPRGACNYRGRYVLPIKDSATCKDTVETLADLLEDEGESAERADWDSIDI